MGEKDIVVFQTMDICMIELTTNKENMFVEKSTHKTWMGTGDY